MLRQGRLDLDADEVLRVVQPSLAFPRPFSVTNFKPLLSDNRQQDVALSHRLVEVFAEIDADRGCVDVQKDVVAAEMRFQAVVNSARDVLAVLAAVGDEYFWHGNLIQLEPSWCCGELYRRVVNGNRRDRPPQSAMEGAS